MGARRGGRHGVGGACQAVGPNRRFMPPSAAPFGGKRHQNSLVHQHRPWGMKARGGDSGPYEMCYAPIQKR